MIFKLEYSGETMFCTAKNMVHLFESYLDQQEGFEEMDAVIKISDEEAKEIQLLNDEYDPENPGDMPEYISLFDAAVGDDYGIIGSTEW